MNLKPNCRCFLSGCEFSYLALRYSDDDSLFDNVFLYNSSIHTLKITFNSYMCKQAMYGIDIESEIHKWITSRDTKVNDLQIWYR